MKRGRFIGVLALAVMLLPGIPAHGSDEKAAATPAPAATIVPGDWPLVLGTPGNTLDNLGKTEIVSTTASLVQHEWTLRSTMGLGIVVGGDTAYVPCYAKASAPAICAADTATGTSRWTAALTGDQPAGLAFTSTMLVANLASGKLAGSTPPRASGCGRSPRPARTAAPGNR